MENFWLPIASKHSFFTKGLEAHVFTLKKKSWLVAVGNKKYPLGLSSYISLMMCYSSDTNVKKSFQGCYTDLHFKNSKIKILEHWTLYEYKYYLENNLLQMLWHQAESESKYELHCFVVCLLYSSHFLCDDCMCVNYIWSSRKCLPLQKVRSSEEDTWSLCL